MAASFGITWRNQRNRHLGDGLAFNLFSDPNISYALYKATDKEIHNALLIDVDNKPVILNIKYFE
jgi:hypothetical protein